MVSRTIGRPALGAQSPGSTVHNHRLTGAGLLTLLLGAALPMIDFFIVNVALPAIDSDLHASSATLELVVTAYGIVYALLLVVGGRLGDAFGRRRLFLVGLAAFTLMSLLCGLAPTALTLVLARATQGASAAMMLPQVLSTIHATTEGEHRARALGRYGATGGVAMVIGQILGGVLVSVDIAGTGWRAIFLVNIPIGIAGLLLARLTVPATRSQRPASVDVAGTALLAGSLLALLVPLMEGGVLGWPAWTWVSLAAAIPLGGGFLVVERRAELAGRAPLLPLSLVRVPSMRRGLGVALPFFCGFGGFMFVAALTLQEGVGLGPLGAGLMLAPSAVTYFVASMSASRLVGRFGRHVMAIGAGLQALGLAEMIAVTAWTWPHLTFLGFVPGLAVMGFGMGMVTPTLFRVVLSEVPAHHAGAGSGVLTTTQQTALALGVAVLGSVFAALALPGSIGMGRAFALVMGLELAMTAVVGTLARRLPDPRH